jgi:hypothetical protein
MEEEKIETIIENALKELLIIGKEDDENEPKSRLLFPLYRKDEDNNQKPRVRVSEQELRFLLAKKLEQENIYYSVETPTDNLYRFKDTNSNGKQISARIDLCLYEKDRKRTHLIELKYDNVDVTNDLEKLLREETERNYFIQFVNNRCQNKKKLKTMESIEKKYRKALKELNDEKKIIEEAKSTVIIFIFIITENNGNFEKGDLYKCKIDKGQSLKAIIDLAEKWPNLEQIKTLSKF